MTPGQRIRARRKELGYRQGELAKMIGIAQGTLSDIERGDTKLPSAEVLIKMATALRVTQAWIVTGEDGAITMPTEKEQELLTMFHALSEEQQQAVMSLVSSMKT